uniref:Glutathione S-transferase n=1 Tax=Echinostoma caproni TaxID=27848 RepID=A0A183B131_9TREM
LEYTLAKLNFLTTMHRHSNDPAAILHSARQLVPYAETYPEGKCF